MNWYKKIASVTFWIADSDKMSKPMNMLDICHDLSKFIYYEANLGDNSGIKYGNVEPDTSRTSFDSPLGYINFYLYKTNVNKQFVEKIIEMYNQSRLSKLKLVAHEENPSESRKGNVVRIEVVENQTVNFEDIPEINLSNSNAGVLLNLLSQEGVSSVSGDLVGQLNINELKNAIADIEANDYILQTHTQEPSEEQGEGGAMLYNGGRSIKQFRRYFEMLKQMIDYVERYDIPNRIINYG